MNDAMFWVYACTTDELAEGRGLGLMLADARGVTNAVALFRSEGVVYAIEDRCPHRGARLSTGPVYEPCKIACLDHGWSIDLRSGRVDPPESARVRTYPVRSDGGALFVGFGERS
ncbi:MAG: Rieske (2Fe-2S) protein [Burkholderiales bacterium]|nr:Rieske (2Fe-2S) protein [Burkholderiales bacterium]